MTSGKPSRPVIWRLSDGKAGHDTQSKGLAEALARLAQCTICDILVTAYSPSILDYINKRFDAGVQYPDPDIIVGAGHGTHIPALQAKRARGGLTIVLMKPTLPLAWFDYCLIPKHDRPAGRDNVIITTGVLNTVVHTTAHSAGEGLVLIGGPSRHFDWDPDSLIMQLQLIVSRQPHIHWTITDSPRTPDSTLGRISEQGWANIDIIPFKDCGTETLQNLYARAGNIWVSTDSISMVYESLASGARVGLLEVPQRQESRVSLAMKSLIEDGLLTSFAAWRSTNTMLTPKYTMNEAARCAGILLQRGIFV